MVTKIYKRETHKSKTQKRKNHKSKTQKSKINKNKRLKSQRGGSIFDKGSNKVAGYVYTRDQSGVFYFGFVRKLYNGGRTRLKPGNNTGAAGTEEKYMGKWTSVGGNRNPNITHLQAIIDELNDETDSKFNSRNDVDASNIKPTYVKPINSKLTLDLVGETNGTIIFIFNMPNSVEFFNIFPKLGNTSPKLLNTSHGEIDAIQSYSMEDIIALQLANNNNYFIYYCINNFNKYLKLFISSKSQTFLRKWGAININNFDDNTPRYPTELQHPPYREISPQKYQ